MVPRAEKTARGVGAMVDSDCAQVAESVSMMALRLGDAAFGARREIVWIGLRTAVSRRVERMLDPTRPVEPMTAAEEAAAAMISILSEAFCWCKKGVIVVLLVTEQWSYVCVTPARSCVFYTKNRKSCRHYIRLALTRATNSAASKSPAGSIVPEKLCAMFTGESRRPELPFD